MDNVLVTDAYKISPVVYEVSPVPPFAIATVPVTLAAVPLIFTLMVLGKLSVTAPVDAEAVI